MRYFNNGDVSPAAWRLKERGHDLIDQIAQLGISRNKIYERLGRKTQLRKRAHFSHHRDENTLRKMVSALECILKHEQQMRAPHKPRRDYSKMFTDKELLRRVGEMNRQRIPRWRKVLLFFYGIGSVVRGKF